jgi:uncharacterized membrane protein YphA (DoxX/SURF4 family)
MPQTLRQAWWGPLVGLLVVGQLVIAAMFVFGDESVEAAIVGTSIALGGALLLVVGLWQRPRAYVLGSTLLVLGCVASAFWFWSLVMPIVAVVVAVGVVISAVRSPRRTHVELRPEVPA